MSGTARSSCWAARTRGSLRAPEGVRAPARAPARGGRAPPAVAQSRRGWSRDRPLPPRTARYTRPLVAGRTLAPYAFREKVTLRSPTRREASAIRGRGRFPTSLRRHGRLPGSGLALSADDARHGFVRSTDPRFGLDPDEETRVPRGITSSLLLRHGLLGQGHPRATGHGLTDDGAAPEKVGLPLVRDHHPQTGPHVSFMRHSH